MSRRQDVQTLRDAHAGRAALILGGGLGLPPEFAQARARHPGALLVSVNHHGCLLGVPTHRDKDLLAIRRELGEADPQLATCDYAVHLDNPLDPGTCPDLMGFDVPRISMPTHPCQYELHTFPRGTGSSGMVAAWLAGEVFGCSPVVLCGFDCYSRGAYWHTPKAQTSGLSSSTEYHVAEWRDRLPEFMNRDLVRVAGGPLAGVFTPL